MKRNFLFWLVISFAMSITLMISDGAALAETPDETYTATKEFEFRTAYHSQRSSVITYNNNIYFAFVDENFRTLIAKKTPDGTITTKVIFEETVDDSHNGPSIGVDRDGYIHIAGNMHHSPYHFPNNGNPYYNYPWQYMVSDNPEDISSFTFRGSDPERTIPGDSITYPFFVRDNEGVLFVSFRVRVDNGWDPGDLGAAIARYDADTQTWTMLGGTDYLHGEKIFFWNNSGISGTAYQPYGPYISFDKDNRMHVTWVADDGSGSSGHHTHVLYTYSDNGGDTFRRADGSTYSSMPITLDSADVVAGLSFSQRVGGFSYRNSVDVTVEGNPVVLIPTENTQGDINYLSFYSPESGWSEPINYPSSYRSTFLIDSHGVITTAGTENGSPGLGRSFDNGMNWKTYPTIEAMGYTVHYDDLYFDQTHQLRYESRTGSSGISRVWTIHFSGTKPPNIPPEPTFGDVPLDHWAYDYIEALYQLGYVAGCSDDPLLYCPEDTMTRAESAVFIERGIHGANYLPDQPDEQIFADVPRTEWFAKWATSLWNDGYTAGCGTDPLIYCPLQGHTRAEGSVFFLRMLHGVDYVPPEPTGLFDDVPITAWYADWVEAAYNAGIITACQTEPELLFCPEEPLDRAMGAYMMVQAKELKMP